VCMSSNQSMDRAVITRSSGPRYVTLVHMVAPSVGVCRQSYPASA
jgi:hypothetical protein